MKLYQNKATDNVELIVAYWCYVHSILYLTNIPDNMLRGKDVWEKWVAQTELLVISGINSICQSSYLTTNLNGGKPV